MLSRKDNATISRVRPGTLMGDLMRRYWIPTLLSSELPALDGDPVRVVLLGEQLIAFRDANGQVGLRGAQPGLSAGGGLTPATMVALRDAGGPLPTAAVTLSAWTDLAATGAPPLVIRR